MAMRSSSAESITTSKRRYAGFLLRTIRAPIGSLRSTVRLPPLLRLRSEPPATLATCRLTAKQPRHDLLDAADLLERVLWKFSPAIILIVSLGQLRRTS